MQKVALVVRSKPSDWISCRSITRNLAESYSMTSDCQFHFVEISEQHSSSQYHMFRTASFLIENQFNKIIFIEHAPNPCPLIHALFELNPAFKPALLIHAFGDFVLQAPIWFAAESILSNYDIRFVCASAKQTELLKSLVDCQDDQIVTIPFPVATEHYFFDESLRKKFRQEQNLHDGQNVFLYSGRLSSQKNIFALLKSFESYHRQFDPESVLFLAGPVDDLGTPYLGKKSPQGLMSYNIQNLISGMNPSEKWQIRYLGDLDSQKLNQAYNGSDIFLSLSTHNDEDYGMAPAEALSTGLFSILTQWGGYAQFKTLAPSNSLLVPVHIHGKSVAPSNLQVTKMMALASNEHSTLQRQKQSLEFQSLVSKKSISSKLAEVLAKSQGNPPIRFKTLFKRIAQSYSVQPHAPFSAGENYSRLYQEVYDVYRN